MLEFMILAVYQPCMESISGYGGGQPIRDVISEKKLPRVETRLQYRSNLCIYRKAETP